jgi:hypothetical protein
MLHTSSEVSWHCNMQTTDLDEEFGVRIAHSG